MRNRNLKSTWDKILQGGTLSFSQLLKNLHSLIYLDYPIAVVEKLVREQMPSAQTFFASADAVIELIKLWLELIKLITLGRVLGSSVQELQVSSLLINDGLLILLNHSLLLPDDFLVRIENVHQVILVEYRRFNTRSLVSCRAMQHEEPAVPNELTKWPETTQN